MGIIRLVPINVYFNVQRLVLFVNKMIRILSENAAPAIIIEKKCRRAGIRGEIELKIQLVRVVQVQRLSLSRSNRVRAKTTGF